MTRQEYVSKIQGMLKFDADVEDINDILDLAVEIYSQDSPRPIVETHGFVVNRYTVTVDRPMYSSKVYVWANLDGVRAYLPFVEVSTSTNTLLFDSPIPYSTISVEYGTIHELTEIENTIPEQHALAVIYLSSHLLSEKEVYGDEYVSFIDNGILRVRYDVGQKTKHRQTYLDSYYKIMAAKSSITWASQSERDENYYTRSRDIFDWNDYRHW